MNQFNQENTQLFTLLGQSYECCHFIGKSLQIGEYSLSFSQVTNIVQPKLNETNALCRFHLSHQQSNQQSHQLQLKAEEITGFLESKYSHFKIRASLLDRPLVLALEHPLYIPPQSQSYLKLSRPIAFELIAYNADEEFKLLLNPTKALRVTSYGLVTQPMLCYHWLASTSEQPIDGNEALVPMVIQNQSKQVIELRKLTLYKGFLKLYKNDSYFVTNEVNLKLTSKQEGFLEYLDEPPSQYGICELLYEHTGETSTKLLKLLRLVGKRGTGIEYGL